MTTMQALVYKGPWQIALENRAIPKLHNKTDVLVKVRATGVCGTDIGIISGEYDAEAPIILGHESAGEVVEIGNEVRHLKVGDRVVIDPTYYCGFCSMCRTGRTNHCEHKIGTETGVSRDGTFAPYYATEERFLFKMPEHTSFEAASLTEPLSCVLTGINQLRIRQDLRTLVLGAGPMGVLYTFGLSLQGIVGGLVEASDARRELCEEVVDPHWKLFKSLEEAQEILSPIDAKFDLIVDTTGVLAEKSIPLLARGGQLLLVGLREGKATFNPREITDKSLSVIGSIDSLGTFSSAKHLIDSGLVPAEKIVTHRMSVDKFDVALSLLGCNVNEHRRGIPAPALKVVMQF